MVFGRRTLSLWCDVESAAAAAGAREKYPKGELLQGLPRRCSRRRNSLDAIDIATPDHMHAVIRATAIKMGKHVYCQKPLTMMFLKPERSGSWPKSMGWRRKLGNQGSASERFAARGRSRGTRFDRQSATGLCVDESPDLAAGMDRPPGSDPVPEGLDWDLWLAPPRNGLTKQATLAVAAVAVAFMPVRLARLAGFWHRRAR